MAWRLILIYFHWSELCLTVFHWIILKSDAGLEEFLSSLAILSGLSRTLTSCPLVGRLWRVRLAARRCLLEVVITRGHVPARYWSSSLPSSRLAGCRSRARETDWEREKASSAW